MTTYSTLERAFQVAKSNTCQSLDELRAILAREGFTDAVAQTSFPLIRKQLQDLMLGRDARQPPKTERRRKTGVLKLAV
jgi:hypothetical protein